VAYVPVAFILAGMTAYTVLAGADFGAGLWTLLAVGGSARARRMRDEARHAMGPVWEANHVWLIFVLVIAWTAYPVAYGSITSTLAAPLLIAAIGIIFRGAAYALRGALDGSRLAEYLFALSSVLTPFALGTAVGAIAIGRVPVGNALGNPVTSWLNPACVLIGALAVVFSGYLAAVYLAADSRRHSRSGGQVATAGGVAGGVVGAGGVAGVGGEDGTLAEAFRRRALGAGLVCGALALAGLLVMRHSGLNLTHGPALVLVCVSAAAGLATLLLCWWYRFELARVTAALAVAAVVVGWAAGQAPRLLPGLTVVQAAAGRSTLVALIVAVVCGAVVLVPSLGLLFTLYLRGRLDTPEEHATAGPGAAAFDRSAAAIEVGDGVGGIGGVVGGGGAAAGGGAGVVGVVGGAVGAVGKGGAVGGSGTGGAPALLPGTRLRAWVTTAVAGLVAGAGLLVFANADWAHLVGVVCLVVCAVAVFRLAAPGDV
jgi:cytochrome bd ubiquinol oxidase subunit II